MKINFSKKIDNSLRLNNLIQGDLFIFKANTGNGNIYMIIDTFDQGFVSFIQLNKGKFYTKSIRKNPEVIKLEGELNVSEVKDN